jgi:transcriptional regulator with XRE-family HTH domain
MSLADHRNPGTPDGLKTRHTAETVSAYGQLLGARIRQIRQQKGLSLTNVEDRSNEEFKASVLGAYERGERTIAVTRLMRLADHYRVPVDQLLPGSDSDERRPTGPAQRSALCVDLVKVAKLGGLEGDLMRRHLGLLQLRRQDFNGRVMSLRHDDERTLAAVFGVREERIRAHLFDLGLLVAA